MLRKYILAGGVMATVAAIVLVVALPRAGSTAILFGDIVVARILTAVGASFIGAGIAMVAVGLAPVDVLVQGKLRYGLVAGGVAIVLVAALWTVFGSCHGSLITSGSSGGGGATLRCQGTVAPFPLLAFALEVVGGLLAGIAIPQRSPWGNASRAVQ